MSINDDMILARLRRAREPKAKKLPTPIAKVSDKKKKEQAEEKKVSAMDKEFYLEIWVASPHKCSECEKKLGKEPLTLFFHHLLEKRNYPEFRYTPENIAILCPDCHSQAEADIEKTPKTKARREKLAKELLK